jgi:predicted DsbA family dithiol-disulfide isomerase
MSHLTDEACRLIEQASEEERRIILAYIRERVRIHALEGEWNTTAEEILTAIARSADITLRGIRGILAEAIFEKRLLPRLETEGSSRTISFWSTGRHRSGFR